MAKKNKKINLHWLKFSTGFLILSSIIAVPAITLASCSCSSSSTTESIKGDGTIFAKQGNNTWNIVDMAKDSLSDGDSFKVILETKIKKACFVAIENMAKGFTFNDGSKSITVPSDPSVKDDLDKKLKSIDKEFDELVDKEKSNSGSWEANLQKILDENGGTIESWKRIKKYDWAYDYFLGKVFSQNYLRIKVGDQIKENPLKSQIQDALIGTNDTSFVFESKIDNSNPYSNNANLDTFLAKIQGFIFQSWLEMERPFIVNMSLWKYSTDTTAAGDIYNDVVGNSSGTGGETTTPTQPPTEDPSTPPPTEDPSTPPPTESRKLNKTKNTKTNSSSFNNKNSVKRNQLAKITKNTKANVSIPDENKYNFPVFDDSNGSNTTWGTTRKFINFFQSAKTQNNYLDTDSKIASAGLKNIPIQFTDDSATYILASQSKIFENLYTEFAAGAISLLHGVLGTKGDFNIFAKQVNVDEETGAEHKLDVITKNFISKEKPASVNVAKIMPEVIKKIINPNGSLSNMINSNVPFYSVDSFKISNSELNEYMLIRNQAGVHAISIDGSAYLSNKSNGINWWDRSGKIILYRYLIEKNGYSDELQYGKIDINLEENLKTFFDANKVNIMYKLLTNDFSTSNASLGNYVNALFNTGTAPKIFGDVGSPERNFFNKGVNYLYNLANKDKAKLVQDKLVSTKTKYAKNYGSETYLNGFASPWVYKQNPTNGGFYISELYASSDSPEQKEVYGTDSYYNDYKSTINPYITSKNLSKLTVSDDSNTGINEESLFKNSNVILSNDFWINIGLVNYTKNNSNGVSKTLLNTLLLSKVQPYFTLDIPNKTIQFKGGENIKPNFLDGLNNYLSNYYIMQKFNAEEVKFSQYSSLMGKNATENISLNDIKAYGSELFWQQFLTEDDDIANLKYNLYLLAFSINDLLANGDKTNEFKNHLDSLIDNNQSGFIVWFNSYNTWLNMSANISVDFSNLLNSTSNSYNYENHYKTQYYSYDGVYPEVNNALNIYSSSMYGQTSTAYNFMNSDDSMFKKGYVGLQTTSNSSLPTILNDRLFKNKNAPDNTSKQGILFQYGSKENLINYINDLTTNSDFNAIVKEIQIKIQNFSLDDIKGDTLEAKKASFIAIINDTSKFDDLLFQQYIGNTGNVSNNYSGMLFEPNSKIGYYADVIQVNNSMFDINNQSPSTMSDFEVYLSNSSDKIPKIIKYGFLFNAAQSTAIINNIIYRLQSDDNNKFTVYDENVKKDLDSNWIIDNKPKKRNQ